MKISHLNFILLVVLISTSCSSPKKEQASEATKKSPSFLEALTFYAPFDGTPDALKALGDPKIYSTENRPLIDSAVTGLSKTPAVQLISGKGLYGDALQFNKKTRNIPFFKSENNMYYDSANWKGTISFWLQLDPSVDLEPGYCDPIQITDVSYNDASIWVDFTNENPRDFRLGVIGDLDTWDPTGIGPNDNPEFDRRLVVVDDPPFSREGWTHVVITFEGLSSGNGTASLFVNGELQGTLTGLKDPFNWDLERSNIHLGLSYVGLMDELALFNRPLSAEEVKELNSLSGGLSEVI